MAQNLSIRATANLLTCSFGAPEGHLKITFVQTSDSAHYAAMLEQTSRTVKAYCDRYDFRYESYLGIKRGYHPWQAAFNRIYMISDLLVEGDADWVIYLDADAYIADFRFDIRPYLSNMSDKVAAAAPSGASDAPWDINSGVIALNARHPSATRLIELWKTEYERVPDEVLRQASEWYVGMHGDQALLHNVLQTNHELLAQMGRLDPQLFNSRVSTFIKQELRAFELNLPSRIAKIASEVDAVFADAASDEGQLNQIRSDIPPKPSQVHTRGSSLAIPTDDADKKAQAEPFISMKAFVRALYQALLLRDGDEAGITDKIDRLTRGIIDPRQVVSEIVSSPEFASKLPEFLHTHGTQAALRFTNDVSQYGETLELLKLLVQDDRPSPILVDVGARGRDRSNSYDLLKHFGWSGLLIEANPLLIDKIRIEFENLSAEIVCAAVSDYDGVSDLTLGINPDVSSLNATLASNWGPPTGTIRVVVRRLHNILEEHNISHDIGLLSLDIEGEDVRALNDLIENSLYRPRYIIIEASDDFKVKSLTQAGLSPAVCEAYELRAQTSANLILSLRALKTQAWSQ